MHAQGFDYQPIGRRVPAPPQAEVAPLALAA
jgi:hypothetical protein